MDLEKLKNPFTLKWRVQSLSKDKTKAICVAYIDARQAQKRFDEVCTPDKWQNTYEPETGVASIAILIGNDWVWKSDVGSESKVEKVKGKASDAFKRAAVLWGVGRDIYEKGTKVIKANGSYPVTSKGQVLYTGDQLSNYLNGLNESQGLLLQLIKQEPELSQKEEFKTLINKLYELVK